MAGGEHDCEWKERHEALTAQHVELATKHQALAENLSSLRHEFEKMKRQLLGPKSEKMPRVSDELRNSEKADPAETKRKRRERSDSRKAHLEEKTTVQG